MGLLGKMLRSGGKYRELVEAHFREGKDQRRLSWDDDDGLTLNVHHDALRGISVPLQDQFDEWKRSGDFEATRDRLREVVEEDATTEAMFSAIPAAAGSDDGPDVIAPGLRLVLVWYEGEEPVFMTPEALAERQLTVEGVRALVAEEALEDEEVFEQVSESVELFTPSVSAGSVLCALPKLKFPELEGEPVLLLIENETLYVFGSRDEAAISAATRLLAGRLTEDTADVLGLCYVLRAGSLKPWLPPATLATQRLLFAALRRAGLENAYALQKKQLQSMSTPLFVASFTVTREQNLPLISNASWASGVNALLPRADLLTISLSLTDHRVVPFQVALERFPELLKPLPKIWPPRYVVTEVPSREALDALGEHKPELSSCFDVEDDAEILVPAPHVIGRESFARECIAVLATLGVEDPEYSEEGFGVRYEGEPPAGMKLEPGTKVMRQLGFATPFKRFGHLPDAERRGELLRYFAEMTNTLGGLMQQTSRETLMPLLQPSALRWRAPLQQELQTPAGLTLVQPRLANRDFCPGLMISFVNDTAQTVQFVSEEAGTKLAGSMDSLFELAMENLRRSTTAPLVEVKPGLFESPLRDEYDATRLLLGEQAFDVKVKGDPVAFVPNRTTLLITGSDDDANLIECFARVRMASKNQARPVTLTPLILTVDGWRPWLPPAGRDARAPLAALAREALELELNASAELVQARFPSHALASLALRDTGSLPELLVSFDASKPTIFPQADHVARAGAAPERWEAFAQAHAARLQPVAEAGGAWFRFTP